MTLGASFCRFSVEISFGQEHKMKVFLSRDACEKSGPSNSLWTKTSEVHSPALEPKPLSRGNLKWLTKARSVFLVWMGFFFGEILYIMEKCFIKFLSYLFSSKITLGIQRKIEI